MKIKYKITYKKNDNNNNNNNNTITHLDTETEFHPMSERLFDMLSNISGFIELNGNTYMNMLINGELNINTNHTLHNK